MVDQGRPAGKEWEAPVTPPTSDGVGRSSDQLTGLGVGEERAGELHPPTTISRGAATTGK
jgi:hypothetical protein